MKNKSALIDAMVNEIDLRKDYLTEKKLSSIYFGGGTPSILNWEDLHKLFQKIETKFEIDKNAEITLEANPDDIDKNKLLLWKDFGINRLSIGLQSFDDAELKWMNRAHTAKQSVDCVKLAQDCGFENLSIDLIYGSKFQTLLSWEKTLEKAIKLDTQHISSYNLTIEGKNKLNTLKKKGLEPEVDETFSSRAFELMTEILEQENFIHYEISNFAKEGFIAVHNSNYWLQKNYLGIGPSAHSYNGNSRQWNVKNNLQYIIKLNSEALFYVKEELSLNDKFNEYILTRLRTQWGCDSGQIEKLFGEKFLLHFKEMLQKYKKYLVGNGNVFTLNRAGKLRADWIASEMFL